MLPVRVTIVLFLLAGGSLGAPTTEKTRYYYPYDKNYVIPEPSIYEGAKRICRDISISDWFWLPTNILWDAMVCTWIPYEEGETYWEDLKTKQMGWF
ncbi:hypothetical protein Ocin01_18537 [Orchesella cincta]|uniref:Uncharacterized protein n=1 Tax=Orchesella cincta TaxID=48709 RepID=A0A1D2M5A4_ORCCI|nr:hypothetical protein Ocin01_18537 [Orchesella cincta]